MLSRAVLLDRDGVLNELVYHRKEGTVSSPYSAKQLRVYPRAAETIKKIQELNYKAIVISNQPGVAKKQFSYAELQRMNNKIKQELRKKDVVLDGEYYCLHHPRALIKKYKANCECRKPKPGMIFQAARDHHLNLKHSFVVGDSLIDVKAGKAAGCKTVLIGNLTDFLNRIIERERAEPDYIIANMSQVADLLKEAAED